MPRWSDSTRAALVETFGTSNQVLDALHRFAEMYQGMLENGGRELSYNRGPWKQFSIQFASWK